MKKDKPSSEKSKVQLDQIFLGDTLDFLKMLPDESMDLVISSPPYNLGKEYEARKALEYYLEQQTEVLRECVRCLKPTGSVFWQVGAFSDKGSLIPLDVRFFPILESFGLIPRNRIVWIRQHGLHGRKKFSCRHETILWFTKSHDYKFDLDSIRVPQKYQNKKHYRGDSKGKLSCNPDGKNPSDVWLFGNVKHNHEEQTIHPCQFPEDMVARIILATTEEGDVVIDPYMGSGTVAVVARDHNRSFLGAELDEKYFKVAQRRLKGEPDESNCFPNLKTLRDYVERTGEPIEKFRFDVQVGKVPSERNRAKIYSEEHHYDELIKRLSFEEDCFSADLRGHNRPEDPLPHNRNVRNSKAYMVQTTLPLLPGLDE